MKVTARVSIGRAWEEASAFLRAERKLLAPLVLALIVVPAVLAELVKPVTPVGVEPEPGAWTIAALLALLIAMVAQLAIMRLALGWDGSMGAALRLALRRFVTVIAALLMFGLVFALASLPFLFVYVMISGTSTPTTAISALFVLATLAVLPRILPLTGIAMAEDLGPWRLLRRSWSLTKGNYWRLLGFIIVFFAASIILTLAVNFTIGTVVAMIAGPPEPLSVARLIVALVLGLLQGVLLSVYAAMLGRIAAQLEAGSKGI